MDLLLRTAVFLSVEMYTPQREREFDAAAAVLAAMDAELQEYAARITEPQARQGFPQQVAHQREIVAARERRCASPSAIRPTAAASR